MHLVLSPQNFKKKVFYASVLPKNWDNFLCFNCRLWFASGIFKDLRCFSRNWRSLPCLRTTPSTGSHFSNSICMLQCSKNVRIINRPLFTGCLVPAGFAPCISNEPGVFFHRISKKRSSMLPCFRKIGIISCALIAGCGVLLGYSRIFDVFAQLKKPSMLTYHAFHGLAFFKRGFHAAMLQKCPNN